MKTLTVFYDTSFDDKERDLYIKSIQKNIDTADLIDLNEVKKYQKTYKFKEDRILGVKPLSERTTNILKKAFKESPWLDIEDLYTNTLPITAESILSILNKDLSNKKIAIINQAETIGKPLAQEIIKRHGNVLSLNSSIYRLDIEEMISNIRPDFLITATGDKDFILKDDCLKNVGEIIDLSHDTRAKRARRHIPTTDILKRRLED